MKERNYYLDFLRGLAAINIIIIHTAFWSGESYVPTIVKNLTLMIDVPFFFFLSGWSLGYINSNIKAVKSLIKIQKQYLFFLVLYSGILFVFSRQDISLNNFVLNVFYCNKIQSKILPVVMGSIWFMPVYFAVVIIFPTFLIYIKNKEDKFLFLLLLCICLFGSIYSQLGFNFFNISIQILFYGFFYTLGFISKNYRITSFKALIFALITIVFLIYTCKKVFLIDKIIVQNLKFPPHVIYMLLSLIFIIIVLYMKDRIILNKNNFLVNIGQHAIFYYFGQGISSSIMFFLIKKINCIWQVKFIIIALLNVILAIIISESIYRLYLIVNRYIIKMLNCNKDKITFFEKI